MLDFTDLITAVRGAIVLAPELSALGGRIFFDTIPENTPRPSCRISSVTDSWEGAYGHSLLDTCVLQFSFFGDLSVVNAMVRATRVLFHGGTLILPGDRNVTCRRSTAGDAGSPQFSSKSPDGTFTYHAHCDIDFLVSNPS